MAKYVKKKVNYRQAAAKVRWYKQKTMDALQLGSEGHVQGDGLVQLAGPASPALAGQQEPAADDGDDVLGTSDETLALRTRLAEAEARWAEAESARAETEAKLVEAQAWAADTSDLLQKANATIQELQVARQADAAEVRPVQSDACTCMQQAHPTAPASHLLPD